MPPLEQLSLETRSRLRSSQILTTLTQLISELVQNSLDANARHIEVGVNCEEWECWVKDDGSGISKAGLFSLSGGADQRRYNTSKAYTISSLEQVDSFGFRGEALASAADVSCIEIASRTSSSRESWSIILKSSETIYSGPSLRWRRESPGTVVTVRDAFFNLPIRRLSHPSAQRTLESIRKEIESFALVFPNVSFVLENDHDRQTNRSDRSRILSIPRTNSTLATFRHLYGRTLADHVEDIKEEQEDVRIEGFISLDGGNSKAYQFLFLNRHLLSICDFHRVIERKFASSSFSRHAYDEYGDPSQDPSAIRRSPRKSEKKPVYVLNITVPPDQIDNCVEPTKTAVFVKDSEVLTSFLGAVIQSFLVKHGFSSNPTKIKRTNMVDSLPSSKHKKRKLEPEHRSDSISASIPPINTTPLVVSPNLEENSESKVTWTDPRTGMRYIVDRRTGNSYPYGLQPNEKGDQDETPHALQTRRTIQPTDGPFDTPDWIRTALDVNKAYRFVESSIPSLSISSPSIDTFLRKWGTSSSQMAGGSQMARLDKEDLQRAKVLSQVDRKFIACVVYPSGREDNLDGDTDAGPSLLLVDQHAADERVRVERFQKDICTGFLSSESGKQGVLRRKLQPPVAVLLTAREVEQLTASKEILETMRRWGFTLQAPDTAEYLSTNSTHPKADYLQVLVDGIPDLLANKLLMKNELRDILKSFLHVASEERDLPSTPASEETPWQAAMRRCPKALLDLIDSKACRGAVMFNDSLNHEQCERLILRLSECALPFQCAHGRPSLVPLTRLEGRPVSKGSPQRRAVDWDKFVCEG